MKIYDNGIVREATAEEIAEFEAGKAQDEEEQKHRQPSDSEVLNILLGGDTE
jgi:hypothetical protein